MNKGMKRIYRQMRNSKWKKDWKTLRVLLNKIVQSLSSESAAKHPRLPKRKRRCVVSDNGQGIPLPQKEEYLRAVHPRREQEACRSRPGLGHTFAGSWLKLKAGC
ncbi:ATP-binding protein [Paenibacillus lautus]|uniref:ATP-binding protein n=1 Tax=Paenibacillus lautus TaxID=1401 RepID=UPI0011430538